MHPYVFNLINDSNLRDRQNQYDHNKLVEIATSQQPRRRSSVGRFIQTIVLLSGLGTTA